MKSLPELTAWWTPTYLPAFEYRKLPFPVPRSKVGVHGVPFAYHEGWLAKNKRDAWAERITNMGVKWWVLINHGDSVTQEIDGVTPVEFLLDLGCIPIIRDSMKFSVGFQSAGTVTATVPMYARYGLQPMWVAGNEPLDPREWPNNKIPPGALGIIGNDLREAAKQIINAGGLFGMPDGPSWSFNPFAWFVDHGMRWVFDGGHAFYKGHHYAKGRDRNYPYDKVTQEGEPLTEQQYRDALDDFWLHRDWMEVWVQLKDSQGNPVWDPETGEPVCDEEWTVYHSLARINVKREMDADPGRNAVGDDVCWRGYERVIAYAYDALGYIPPMMVGEGGYCPRDRPGSGNDLDWRMPYTTPRGVARQTEAILFDDWSPFFAICPWLLGDDSMVTGGYVGWPHDAWVGWAWTPMYDYEKPVCAMLRENHNPSPPDPIESAIAHAQTADLYFSAMKAGLHNAHVALKGGP